MDSNVDNDLDKTMPKKTVKKNVKRQPPKPKRFGFKALLRAFKLTVAVTTIGAMIGVSGYYGSQLLQQFLSSPIKAVQVSGEFNYLGQHQVKQLINQTIDSSFVRENLDRMREQLEESPWVDAVILRRQWPDTLHVTIVEQRPIARWRDDGFVNHRGDIVSLKDAQLLQHLPKLDGENQQAQAVMKQYQLLSQLFSEQGLKLIELNHNPVGGWHLYLDNGWQITAGRTAVVKKVQQFVRLLQQGKIQSVAAIESVDLRYENGLAIRWQEAKVDEQQAHTQTEYQHEKTI